MCVPSLFRTVINCSMCFTFGCTFWVTVFLFLVFSFLLLLNSIYGRFSCDNVLIGFTVIYLMYIKLNLTGVDGCVCVCVCVCVWWVCVCVCVCV